MVEFEKNYCDIWNQHPWVLQNAKFHVKQKSLSLRPKLPYLGIFWLQFKKTIFIFNNNTREFLRFQSFLYNEKTLNVEPKPPYLSTFRPKFEKTIAIFEISTFEFLNMQSFMLKKWKWDQNYHILVFLDWNLPKLLSYLKSAPSSLPKMNL